MKQNKKNLNQKIPWYWSEELAMASQLSPKQFEKWHQEKTKKETSVGITLILVIVAALVVFFLLAISGSLNLFNPSPNPQVLDVNCDSYNTGLFEDTRVKMSTTIKNNGGSGDIRIRAFYDSEGTEFDSIKHQTISMTKNQIQTTYFDFDASKFRSGICRATVEAVP